MRAFAVALAMMLMDRTSAFSSEKPNSSDVGYQQKDKTT